MTADARELYKVLRYVRPLHLLSARVVAAALAGEQVSMGIRAVLEQLELNGPASVPEIGRVLLLPRQMIQRVVDQAADLGLVTAEPNPAHRRSSLIVLTDPGRAAFRRIHTAEMRKLAQIADKLEPDEITAAVHVLDVLAAGIAQLSKDDPAAATRDSR